jgi:hypothetical protein
VVAGLMERFVPAADEVWRLQNRDDAECRLFQQFCEEGHYGGRKRPSDTRQGIYACAPGGVFLASINSTRAEHVAEMMRQALHAWEDLEEEKRYLPEPPPARPAGSSRAEHLYPEDGLVLRVHSRDLERAEDRGDWRQAAWNLDFAWFRAGEVRELFGAAAAGEVGASHAVPEALIARLARCHLVDNVRGQTPSLQPKDVKEAALTAVLESREGDVARIRLEGAVKILKRGRWQVERLPAKDQGEQELGYEPQLLGWAEYDAQRNRVTSFELVAFGLRWGATRFNARWDDRGKKPLGIVFTLAGEEPADRVAPASIWAYGW